MVTTCQIFQVQSTLFRNSLWLPEGVRYLTAAGVRVNKGGGRLVVQILVEAGADPYVEDEDKATRMGYAEIIANPEIIDLSN